MSQDAKVQIGLSTDYLEGVGVDTPAGTNLFREGVVLSDPDVSGARAKITNSAPATDAYALAVRVVGQAVAQADTNVTGAWAYAAGTSGTVTLPAGSKVLQISATSLLGGSFTVNDGAAITIPANQQFTLEPRGNLVAPTLVFTSTTAYVVEYVS